MESDFQLQENDWKKKVFYYCGQHVHQFELVDVFRPVSPRSTQLWRLCVSNLEALPNNNVFSSCVISLPTTLNIKTTLL